VWPAEWSEELADLVSILTTTCEARPEQFDLLTRICDGPLVLAADLPRPLAEERDDPKNARNFAQGTLFE
jgi:hypothetical protein